MSTPQEEEREALAKQRQLDKAHRALAEYHLRVEKEAVWVAIKDTAQRYRCRCPLHRGMTKADVRGLGAGCTDPWYICPRLVHIRRLL